MSLAVSTIISDARLEFNGSSIPTSDQCLRLLNRCRKNMASRIGLAEDEYSISSEQYVWKYTFPAVDLTNSTARNIYSVKDIRFFNGDDKFKVDLVTLEYFEKYGQDSGSASVDTAFSRYYIKKRSTGIELWLWPILSEGADIFTLAGDHSDSQTTCYASSDVSNCAKRFIVGTEVIEYQYKDSGYITGTVEVTNGSAIVTGNGTEWEDNAAAGDRFSIDDETWYEISSVDSDTQITLTEVYAGTTSSGESYYRAVRLYGCSRGAEGTTAATHSSGDECTERDIIVTYNRYPSDLGIGDTVEDIFEGYTDVFVYFIAWKARLKDSNGITGNAMLTQAKNFKFLYEEALNNMMWAEETNVDEYDVLPPGGWG